MKRPSKEIKRIARDILNDRYGVPMGAFVAVSIIVAVMEIPFSMSLGANPTTSQLIIVLLAEFLITLVSFVLSAGVTRVHLNMTRGAEFRFLQIFDPFRSGTERFFGAGLIQFLLGLAACLPLIGGLIYFIFAETDAVSIAVLAAGAIISLVLAVLVTLNFYFVDFFLLDYPQMKVLAAFRECRLLMKGNRGRLFYLFLSFIGWSLLILCSLGIAALWVRPYMNQTFVIFYLDCTGELDRIPVRTYPAPEASGGSIFF